MISARKLLIEFLETVIDQACCAILELDCKAGKTNFLSPDRQFGTMIECVDLADTRDKFYNLVSLKDLFEQINVNKVKRQCFSDCKSNFLSTALYRI